MTQPGQPAGPPAASAETTDPRTVDMAPSGPAPAGDRPAHPPPVYPPPGYPPYASAPRPGTPGMLIATGVVLLVLAVLALLWCLLFIVYGALLGSIGSTIQNNPGDFTFNVGDTRAVLDAMGPVLVGLGVFALLVALAHGAAGIGVIGRRSWARIAGLVLGGLGLTLNLLGLALSVIGLASARPVTQNGITFDPAPSFLVGVVVLLVFAAAYGFVVVALARRGADFA